MIMFKSLRILVLYVQISGVGGWVVQQKSERCSDFEICWKKWMLPNAYTILPVCVV